MKTCINNSTKMSEINISESITEQITAIGQRARTASRALAGISTEKKNNILLSMADSLERNRKTISDANKQDVADAGKQDLATALIDRLLLTDSRINSMAAGIRDVAALPDPVGRILGTHTKANGLEIQKRAVPIGVIGMIYESRPNVTADAAALCLKSSNAIILRGGSEALRSNRAIADALVEGGRGAGLPEHSLQLVPMRDRLAVKALITMQKYVDLIIPRGGEGLIRAVAENATVPVLKHYKGVCHIYVDGGADLKKALSILENAKCQRPGVCNAAETLLVDRAIADSWVPVMAALLSERSVELRGDQQAQSLARNILPATEEDWYTEYLDLILAVRIVDGIEQAVEHINHYGSGHSDAIVTENPEHQNYFTRMVDSAAVYVNASTRFTDGAEFGMGAEIGISTDRLHARGPVGLEELTTYKYVVFGNGQIRE
ncbi:MAG: glutamate-5-semialdehyde dehydrogenase [Cyclonatronaceae bacterium]